MRGLGSALLRSEVVIVSNALSPLYRSYMQHSSLQLYLDHVASGTGV